MTIGLGFIGAGAHARHHMKEFARIRDAELVAVYDLVVERAEEAARDFPALRIAVSLDDLLLDPRVTAVVVATPAETHEEIALAAINAGLDILLEKPMAHTVDSARAILNAVERNPQTILMVGHCERFNPSYLDIRKAVDDGHVGKPRFLIASRISPRHLNNDAWKLGVLDTAVHDIDILLWLVGEPVVSVAAQGVSVAPESSIFDHAAYQIRFAGGALADGAIGWLPFSKGYPMQGNAHPRLFVSGTKGVATLDLWQRPAAVHTYSTGGYFWPDSVLTGYGDYSTEVTFQDAAFIDAVLERRPSPIAPRSSYDALRVAHAAHVSMTQRQGMPVQLEEE